MLRCLNCLILILSYIHSCYSETLWKVEFLQEKETHYPEPVANKFKLVHGRFSTVYAKFTKTHASPTKHLDGGLSLASQTDYRLGQIYNPFDTRISLSFKIEIGINCGVGQPDYETKIRFASPHQEIQMEEISISFETTSSEFKFDVINPKLPLNGFGILYAILPYKLVDDETINFKEIGEDSKEDDGAFEVETLTIPAYSGRISQEVKIQFGFKKETTRKKRVIQMVYAEGSCFTGKEKYTIEFVDTSIPNVTNIVNSIAETARQDSMSNPGEITVSMRIDLAPIVAHCVMQATFDDFLEEKEIIYQTIPESSTLCYSYKYIQKAGLVKFTFSNLEYYTPYKMKCIFKSIEFIKQFYVDQVITFGYFAESQVKILLQTKRDPNIFVPAQCFTWVIDTFVQDRFEFINKTLSYCWDYFTNDIIERKDNGCLICEEKKLTESYEIDKSFGVCIRSNEVCKTNFTGDIVANAIEFKNSLATGKLIKEKLDLPEEIYEVERIVYENDNTVPDITKIHLEEVNILQTKMTFKIYTTEKMKVECYLLVTEQSIVNISVYDFTKNYTIDNDKPENTFEYEFFVQSWDKVVYNLIFQCKNIPAFVYVNHFTKPFSLLQFRHDKEDQKVEPIHPVDCNLTENKFNIQCIIINHRSIVNLETNNPRNYQLDSITNFIKATPSKQILLLQGESELKEDSLEKNLNKLINANSFLSLINCPGYINFTECYKIKQNTTDYLMEFLNQKLGGSDIIANLENGKTDNILMALQAIFYSVDNSDTFTEKAHSNLLGIIKNVHNNLPNLFNNQKENVKRDIIRIIASYLSIYADLSLYKEIEGAYNDKILNSTKMINSTELNTHVEMQANMLDQMAELGIEVIDIDINDFEVHSIENTDSKMTQINRTSYGVSIDYPIKYLINQFKAKKIAFNIYKEKYPMLSFRVQNKVNSKGISIKVYDEKNKTITINTLPLENRFVITFPNYNNESYCYYYSNTNMTFMNLGIESNRNIKDILKCKSDHLTDFLPFSIKVIPDSGMAWWVILIIVVVCLAIMIVSVFAFYKVRNKNTIDNEIKSLGQSETPMLMKDEYINAINY